MTDDAPAGALQDAIASASSPLLIVTPDGDVLAANDAFRASFGGAPRTVDDLRALCPPGTGGVLQSEAGGAVDFASMLRAGETASGVASLREASGRVVRTGYSVTPIGAGAPYGGAILALQPLESLALKPEPVFTALAESAPCIVWVADPDGTILFANREWGRGAEATKGAAPLTALHPDDLERCRALWESALREGVMYEATARHRGEGHTYRRFLTRAVPLGSEAGDVVAWFGTTTDLEGADGTAAARESGDDDRDRNDILAVASHELRAPLAVLRGMIQITRRRGANRQLTDEELREALSAAEAQADRLTLLVEQLLDHARLGIGRLDLHRAPCDVTALVRGVVDRLSAASEGQVIEVREAGPVMAEVDADRVEQVLVNLLDNAVKFSPAQSRIDVRVVRVVSGETEVAEIAVRDRGRGVPPTERSLIFERFHQVTSDDSSQGLGLGLAISKEIVELHGGTMSVGAPRGGGARFVVRLPISEPRQLEATSGG